MSNRSKKVRGGQPKGSEKKPVGAIAEPSSKKPRHLGIDHAEAWKRHVVWRFGDLDLEGPPTSAPLTVDDFKLVCEKLAAFETQSCSEIWSHHDNGCHRYDLDDAHDNITKRLAELQRDDETALHTVRVNGPFRVWGVLRENIFYLLWIDRDHEMWPSKLKHT